MVVVEVEVVVVRVSVSHFKVTIMLSVIKHISLTDVPVVETAKTKTISIYNNQCKYGILSHDFNRAFKRNAIGYRYGVQRCAGKFCRNGL